MNAEHDVKPAWARLASWTAGLPAIALACAASGALAGTRPMDAYFDAQIAVAKKTIDACIAANEGTSSASGCDDEDKVFLPAFYPRIVAPIFSRIDLSSPSATLDKVQSGYAKEASQLTQLEVDPVVGDANSVPRSTRCRPSGPGGERLSIGAKPCRLVGYSDRSL